MPNRHGPKILNNREQRECSSASSQGAPRAHPAVSGRIPLREEAEILTGVTQASAEPLIGAIRSGPSNFHSEGSSPQPLEVDSENSRVVGMGRLPDGSSRSSSISFNPLRNNNVEPLLISAPSLSGDTPIEWPFTLANSGTDPTTNVLSEMEIGERQEGAKELTTDSDIFHTHSLNLFTFNDNFMSHSSTLFPDKQLKNLKISGSTVGPENLAEIPLS